MQQEIKVIISEANFKSKVGLLKDDMYLYHRSGDEDFNTSNGLNYALAILYRGRLYDINIGSISQFKDEYNFNNAIQKTLELIERQNFSCKIEDYIQSIIDAIQDNKWVTNWILPIIEDYDKENGTNYYQKALETREEIKALRKQENEERERTRREKQEQEDKKREEQKKIEEEQRAEENFCNGFIDKLSPMRQQKIANVLNKWIRYDNGIMQRKDNVLVRLRDGWTPRIIKMQDKEKHTLSKDNLFIEITKTEFDYANYLLEYGLDKAKLSSEIKKK